MSKKIQMVREGEKPSDPIDVTVKDKKELGLKGVDDDGGAFGGDVGPVGEVGDPGNAGIDSLPLGVAIDPDRDQDKLPPEIEEALSHVGIPDIAKVRKEMQPDYFNGPQNTRRVCVARNVYGIEVHGVGVIIDGVFLQGYKMVDIVDMHDPTIVTERAIRRISG